VNIASGEAGASAQGKAGTVPSHCAAAPGAGAQGADDVADGERWRQPKRSRLCWICWILMKKKNNYYVFLCVCFFTCSRMANYHPG
jgi:hypothetical protein